MKRKFNGLCFITVHKRFTNDLVNVDISPLNDVRQLVINESEIGKSPDIEIDVAIVKPVTEESDELLIEPKNGSQMVHKWFTNGSQTVHN